MTHKRQLLRFGAVGAINTLLDFGLLFILKGLGLPKEVANITSTGIAFIFSFVANKNYTFKTAGTNVRREMTLFIIITLFGLWGLQTPIIYFATPLITSFIKSPDSALIIAKLLATVVSMTWNYLMYHYVVFKKTA